MKQVILSILLVTALAGLGVIIPHPAAAGPSTAYPITPEAGKWLICAASFTGPQAGQLANELAGVIRQNYKLPAYVFDRGGDERRKQEEEIARVRELTGGQGRVRRVRIEEQFAVLVGGYPDMESARKALDDFKKLPTPPEKFCDKGILQREGTKDGQKGVWIEEVLYSPFRTSFVVHNPTLPKEQIDKGNDFAFLKQLNADESFSLLKCPKPWTLAVQTFYGGCVVQPHNKSSKFLDLLPFGKKEGEQLNAAALQAHELANALRQMKINGIPPFEAYVLHTRNCSIVTIGAYDSPDDERMMNDYQLLSKMKLQQGAGGQIIPKPMPMPVPRP